MRIGIFTDTYPPYINGVSTSIVMLQRALEKKGHEVFIVTVNSENLGYKFENSNKVVRIPGIPVGIYDYRLTGIYPLRAIEIIKKWDLDVIHSHTEFGIGTFARIIAKQFDIPLVHTYHTMYEDYVHYLTKGYFNGASRRIVEYLTKFYCDKTATELIVPTKKTYDLFKEKYKVDRSVHIIPTGIEIDRFYKEKYEKKELEELRKKIGINKDDFVILFVGRLGKEKSVDLLIDSHTHFVKKHPNVKLLIIGDGPDMETFKKMVVKSKLTDKVIFTGKVPWEEVPKYYQLATIFATASRSETQGLTVIEAMAASVPVVAADDESFKMIVIDDLNGYLFKNKRQYKKSVEKLINDPDKLKKMCRQARNTSEPHSSKYFADNVLTVYKIAVGDRFTKEKKTFFSKFKTVVKRGFNGK
jgi:1,2-diacylglycerol 3-alpha-glucosyltransferase